MAVICPSIENRLALIVPFSDSVRKALCNTCHIHAHIHTLVAATIISDANC